MSDIPIDAAGSFDYLNQLTGGTDFWLDPDYTALIVAATDVIAEEVAIDIIGPATTTAFSLVGPYEFAVGGTITLTMTTPSVVVVFPITTAIRRRGALAIALRGAVQEAMPAYSVLLKSGADYGEHDFSIVGGISTIASIALS